MGIKRREFVAGVAVSAASLAGRTAAADSTTPAPNSGTYYPPGLTGLRGSHPGSFEAAHALAFGNTEQLNLNHPDMSDDTDYDLIVVGAGISGLSAAYYWQQARGSNTRILLLDNHDDIGGHAKRNEFNVDGHHLIGYGGSQSIEAPANYSHTARTLLNDLGINPERFYDYYDRDFTTHNQLGSHWFFDASHFGKPSLTPNPLGADWLGISPPSRMEPIVDAMPISLAGKAGFLRLLTDPRDWLEGKTTQEKIEFLRSKSYEQYLRDDLAMPEEVIVLLRNRAHGLWAVGYDAVSALAAAHSAEPGTTTLGLEDVLWGDEAEEPYIFHFPDGNASIARLLVHKLIPAAIAGGDMDDVVTAALDYPRLDSADSPVRIRLNSTVVDVRHESTDGAGAPKVNVTYHSGAKSYQVSAKQVILACYNHVIPHICPELPNEQVEALRWPEKAPLVYTNVALKNWRAFKKAELFHFQALRDFWVYGALDFPVSMPRYEYSRDPNQPIVLHMVHVPTDPGKPARAQYREGRRKLLGLRFEDFEAHLRRQLMEMLAPYGFDFDADVAAITVNRWPHGYAYEYIDLWDPPEWGPENGPHVIARKPLGNIAIANSDSSAYAYVNGAIDAARRAVDELQSGQL